MITRIDRTSFKTQLFKTEMTLKDVAEKTGLSYSTLAGISTGRSCKPETAEAIADALNVPLSKILEKR